MSFFFLYLFVKDKPRSCMLIFVTFWYENHLDIFARCHLCRSSNFSEDFWLNMYGTLCTILTCEFNVGLSGLKAWDDHWHTVNWCASLLATCVDSCILWCTAVVHIVKVLTDAQCQHVMQCGNKVHRIMHCFLLYFFLLLFN